MALLEGGGPSLHHSPCVSNPGFVREMEGDLFRAPRSTSLAHCVSSDMKMGAGIALLFRKKFGCVEDLMQQKKKVGEVAYLKDGSRYIFYLVTKRWFYDKPTETTLHHSLLIMKSLCNKFGVRTLAMPRIGCGLDGLKWPFVYQMVHDVFSGTGMEVTIYSIPDKATPTMTKAQERFRSFFESRQPQSAPSREICFKRKSSSYSSQEEEEEFDTPKKRRRTASPSHQSSTPLRSVVKSFPLIASPLNNLDICSENSKQKHVTSRLLNMCKLSATNRDHGTSSGQNDSEDLLVVPYNRKTVIPVLVTDDENDINHISKKVSASSSSDFILHHAEEADRQSGGWTSEEEGPVNHKSNSKHDKNVDSVKKNEVLTNSNEDLMLYKAAKVFDGEHMTLMGQKKASKIETLTKISSDSTLKITPERDEEKQTHTLRKHFLNSLISRKTHTLSDNSDDAGEVDKTSGGWSSEEEVSEKIKSNIKKDECPVSMLEKELVPKERRKNCTIKSSDSTKKKKKKLLKSSKDKEKKSRESKKKHKRERSESSDSDNESSRDDVKNEGRRAVARAEGQGRRSEGSWKNSDRRAEGSIVSNRGLARDASQQKSVIKESQAASNSNHSDSGNEHEEMFPEPTWDAEDSTAEQSSRKYIKCPSYEEELITASKPSKKSKTLEKFKSRLGPIAPETFIVTEAEEDQIAESTQIFEANVAQSAPTISKPSKLEILKSRLGLFVENTSDAERESEDEKEDAEAAFYETSFGKCIELNRSGRNALLDRFKKPSFDKNAESDSSVPIVKRKAHHPEHASLNILKKALKPIVTGSMYSDRENSRVSAKARLSLPK